MFEPGMKMLGVSPARDGEDARTFILPAFDVDDAVARARNFAAEANQQGATDDNPFDNLEGLEARGKPAQLVPAFDPKADNWKN